MAEREETTDELDRYWDDVVRGDWATARRDLDPRLAAKVRRLHGLDDAPPPDPVFIERLQEALTGVPPRPSGAAFGPVSTTPNGRMSRRALGRLIRRPPRRRWPAGQLATAALLLLTVVSGILAYGTVRPGSTDRSAGLPAPTSRPTAIALPPGVTVEQLLGATVDGVPAAPVRVTLERWTFPPGPDAFRAPGFSGPLLIVMEAGRLAITVEGTAWLMRDAVADSAQPEQVMPGTNLTLEAGDQLVIPPGTGFSEQNAGQEPAVKVAVPLLAGSGGPEGATWNASAIAAVDLAVAERASLPTGALRVTLARYTLMPGVSLPPQAVAGLELIAVEAGTLGLTLAGDQLPGRHRATPDAVVTYGTGSRVPTVEPGVTRSILNAGEEPLVVLVASLSPAAEEGTPAP
jgi:hypothetical protein